MVNKTYVHECTVGELRDIFTQTVFGQSDDDLQMMFTEHGITAVGIDALLDNMRDIARRHYFVHAAEYLAHVMLRTDYTVAMLRDELETYRIPDHVKVWSWE